MTLRINHNIAAINAHRNLVRNDTRLRRTLEHLSSGEKVNRAADGPATLVISEHMRAQVAGLKQAVMNSETAVSMVQTTEASLAELNNLLIRMRQLAIHAANEGANDVPMMEADQAELTNALDSIDRIARTAQFGTKPLLDGSLGINGIAAGDELHFVGATYDTREAPQNGYRVEITQEGTQAQITSMKALSREMIDAGERLTFIEGRDILEYQTRLGLSLDEIRDELNAKLKKAGIPLDVYFDNLERLVVHHQEYGSKPGFTVLSSSDGFLSERTNIPLIINNGIDVQGRIGDDYAVGDGQVLTGGPGSIAQGLKVRFTGLADSLNPEVGRVMMESNALTFQIGGNHNQLTHVLIPGTASDRLGRKVDTKSRFTSLRDLDLRSHQEAEDSILIIDRAIDEVTGIRGELGSLQKNTLESNIVSLRVAKENMIHSESMLRDTDMASEMSEFTKYQIMSESAVAMLAQANQSARNVLSLLQ